MVDGRKIKKYRLLKSMSQAELAKLADVTQSHISELEANRKMPSAPVLFKIADALGIKVDDLNEG